MFIYIVQQGDSLYSISQKFAISIDILRAVNGLTQENIVPGQALVIASSKYIVQPGDSLYKIAQVTYVSSTELISANPGISPTDLQVGTEITIPILPYYEITTLGYYVLRTPEMDKKLIKDYAPYTTYMKLFEYHFHEDGSLSDLNDLPAIQQAWESNSPPFATITNLTEVGFSSQLTNQVLNSAATRKILVDNIYRLVVRKGYAGVNIDFEQNLPADRDVFSQFLLDLKRRLEQAGLILSIAVPPKTSDNIPWYEGYDYGAIGAVVDLVFIMTYDWHHAASEPGPVAPINEVRRTIEYAMTKMARSKILIGVPFYGYDWPLPYRPEIGGKALSTQAATLLAMNNQVPISYSKETESAFFYYYDAAGQRHVVWFDDSRSMAEKMKLLKEYGIGGIGAWQLTLGMPQGPWILRKFYHVKKV